MPPGMFNPVIRPAEGTNVSGCSALILHSRAWPLICTGPLNNLGDARAGCDHELSLDQIGLRSQGSVTGLLHLNAGVNLDEVEIPLFIHDELDGSGIGVANLTKRVFELGAD